MYWLLPSTKGATSENHPEVTGPNLLISRDIDEGEPLAVPSDAPTRDRG
jgi:hypothetical protein